MKKAIIAGSFAGACVVAAAAAFAQPVVVTFADGTQGWEGPQGPGGATQIVATGGNPDERFRTVFNNFGITFSNDVNSAFLGDYSRFSSVTISFDIKVDRVEFFGQPVTRPLLIDLRDNDPPESPYPWNSVYFSFPPIDGATDVGWQTRSVTITDTESQTLPSGWRGYGDEDPQTFEPRLPPGVTFADVISSVETIAITTLEPGYFFGFTDFDVSVDNITISGTPRTVACGPADVGSAGGVAGPDGLLDNNDFIAFIDLFFAQSPGADRGEAGGLPGSDGAFDNNDFIVFINQFFDGCSW